MGYRTFSKNPRTRGKSHHHYMTDEPESQFLNSNRESSCTSIALYKHSEGRGRGGTMMKHIPAKGNRLELMIDCDLIVIADSPLSCSRYGGDWHLAKFIVLCASTGSGQLLLYRPSMNPSHRELALFDLIKSRVYACWRTQ